MVFRPQKYKSEYKAWHNIIQRCENKNDKKYRWYGGRGITVCERWKKSFINFYDDMGSKPTPNHSIDRINNDGNYDPQNCRWATMKRQVKNRKKKSNETCNPRVPIFINDAVQQYAKDHGCTGVHAYETLVTLGLQRQKSFEEMLDGK